MTIEGLIESTRCVLCGSYERCECASKHDIHRYAKATEPTKQHWTSFIQRLMLTGDMLDDRRWFFGTFTFGCTKCACPTDALCHVRPEEQLEALNEDRLKWSTCHEEYHVYLKPGPQAGRKRFTRYFDYISNIAPISKVYGAEERGSAYSRLHYHAVAKCDSELSDTVISEISNAWGHGFALVNRIENLQDSIDYITKYTTKTQLRGQPYAPPFYFFNYDPISTNYPWKDNGAKQLEIAGMPDKLIKIVEELREKYAFVRTDK